jgi:flagellar hook-basal body complex protein FliE
MSIDPILPIATGESVGNASPASPIGFSDWLAKQLDEVNRDIAVADDSVRRLAIGEPVNLHQVMINLDRAKLRFELVLQVRNKLLEAYQDLQRTQV